MSASRTLLVLVLGLGLGLSWAISKTNNPWGGVPGDLHQKLVQEFPIELAAPVGKIFRGIMWLSDWTVEHAIRLKKTKSARI